MAIRFLVRKARFPQHELSIRKYVRAHHHELPGRLVRNEIPARAHQVSGGRTRSSRGRIAGAAWFFRGIGDVRDDSFLVRPGSPSPNRISRSPIQSTTNAKVPTN